MNRNFLAAILAAIGLSSGPYSAPRSSERSTSSRWPYSGKNRAQRHRLNAGFAAMS
jgi:hypothetical protein